MQYHFVLHSRRQQLAARQRRVGSGGGDAGCEQERQLGQLATVLEAGLDWELVGEIAGGPGSCCSSTQLDRVAEAAALPAARDRKAAGASKGAGTAAAAISWVFFGNPGFS